MEEETVTVKEDKPKEDLVIPEVDLVIPEVVIPEEVKVPYRNEYTITWVDGNEYDVVVNESGIYWTKKSQIPLEENILNE
jgi:hypothetical protein